MKAPACHAPARFGDRFPTLCAQAGIDAATLCWFDGTDTEDCCHSYGSGGAAHCYPVLCNAKLLTALLVLLLCTESRLSVEDPVVRHLPLALGKIPGYVGLLDVRIGQLLAHTHGLAASFERAPFTGCGFIDGAALLAESARHGRLFTPGRFYSYGALGYVLLGLVLETRYRKPLAAIFRDTLARHLGPCAAGDPSLLRMKEQFCPASGHGLALSPRLMLRLCRYILANQPHLGNHDPGLSTTLFTPRTTLPGWSPQITCGCYGWRGYGKDWYGHNGLNGNTLFYVRVNPVRNIALCLAARAANGSQGLLSSLLLQEHFPELLPTPASQPRIRRVAPTPEQDPLPGSYGSRLQHYTVYPAEDRLMLRISRAGVEGKHLPVHITSLYPAEDSLYYLEKPWHRTVFVQLVRDGNGAGRFLWDHDQVWPAL